MREMFKFTDSDNKELNVYKWTNDQAKGVIHICHGMAETALRYDKFAIELCRAGFVVYAHEHRGHGLSSKEDELGYIADSEGFEWMVKDIYEVMMHIKDENKGLPVILFGHSMGSFLSQRFVEIYGDEIQALILSGTNGTPPKLTNIGIALSKIEMAFKGRKHKSKMMDKLSFGNFNNTFKPNRTDYDWICSVDSEVDKYINDPLCGFICTTSFYYDLLRGLKSIHLKENLKKIPKDLPIYIFAGDKDPVGNCGKGILDLYNIFKNLDLEDVSYKLYKDGRHEMLNEEKQDEVIRNILNWISGESEKIFNVK